MCLFLDFDFSFFFLMFGELFRILDFLKGKGDILGLDLLHESLNLEFYFSLLDLLLLLETCFFFLFSFLWVSRAEPGASFLLFLGLATALELCKYFLTYIKLLAILISIKFGNKNQK